MLWHANIFVNGESMVYVKGSSSSAIANVQELGLAEGPIRITFDVRHRDVLVDAWGRELPADTQYMLAGANISMNLLHYDPAILETCWLQSWGGVGGGAQPGVMNRAGTLLGGNAPLYAANNYYITLQIASPQGGRPWRFFYCFLTGQPVDYPLGTEKSSVICYWRAIPYTVDPWNGGLGAYGTQLYDHTLAA